MTLLAEERQFLFEKFRVVGSMRCVASRAIFRHGSVLEKERPAFFSVAFKTFLVCGIGGNQVFRDRSVRIVAVHAGHLALQDRMVAGAFDFGLFVLMALKTDFVIDGEGQ